VFYAYSIDDQAHNGLLKVGQTTRDIKQRIAERLGDVKSHYLQASPTTIKNLVPKTVPKTPDITCTPFRFELIEIWTFFLKK